MPICLESKYSNYRRTVTANLLRDKPPAAVQERSRNCITIGLINNMPDAALEATERQFLSLLDSASEGIHIRLSFHALPSVPRNELGARHVRNFYSSVDNLWGKKLDGLIVTGREPLTPNLRDEPYWESFAKVVEWAKDNTYSTVWSCLAAHAAVLHMDGIGRIKSNDKYCGVFKCDKLPGHPLTTDAPSCFKLPHSRWNGIAEDALTSCGYSVLTRSPDVGVDTFVKKYESLFVYFQGHPEYESNTLLLEYRRDVGRYLRGETNAYPLMPRGYFDDGTAIGLTALQNEAMSRAREDLLAQVSTTLENSRIEHTWQVTAACLYRNWLDYICEQKELRLKGTRAAVQAHGIDGLAPMLATTGLFPIVTQDRRSDSKCDRSCGMPGIASLEPVILDSGTPVAPPFSMSSARPSCAVDRTNIRFP
jgi:homoserine O-succinyltransferase/O-acetyltransferase